MSSKSTPLNQLRNRNQPSPQQPPSSMPQQDEATENDLVNEILQEIDDTNEPMPNNMDTDFEQPIYMQQPQAPQYQEPPQVQVAEPTKPVESFFDSLKNNFVVGVIVLLLCNPMVSQVIEKVLPNKDIIKKYTEYIVMLVKALLGVIMSFCYQNFM